MDVLVADNYSWHEYYSDLARESRENGGYLRAASMIQVSNLDDFMAELDTRHKYSLTVIGDLPYSIDQLIEIREKNPKLDIYIVHESSRIENGEFEQTIEMIGATFQPREIGKIYRILNEHLTTLVL